MAKRRTLEAGPADDPLRKELEGALIAIKAKTHDQAVRATTEDTRKRIGSLIGDRTDLDSIFEEITHFLQVGQPRAVRPFSKVSSKGNSDWKPIHGYKSFTGSGN